MQMTIESVTFCDLLHNNWLVCFTSQSLLHSVFRCFWLFLSDVVSFGFLQNN